MDVRWGASMRAVRIAAAGWLEARARCSVAPDVLLSALICASSLLIPRAIAQEAGRSLELIDEYRVKAVYLYSLSKFILWPNEHTWRSSSPLDICVYGNNPFTSQLDALGSHAARSHPIVVRAIEPERSALGCRILFIGANNDLPPELSSGELTAAGILTVGESEEFLQRGGLVSLLAENDGVRVALNYSDARRAGFVIDGGLVDVAKKRESPGLPYQP